MARAVGASRARPLAVDAFSAGLATQPQLTYLLQCEDQFLVDQALAAAVKQLLEEGPFRDYNLGRFHGPAVDLDAVVNAAMTYPAFATRRVVVVRDLDLVAAGRHEDFLAYLRKPAASTVLVATVGKSRKKKTTDDHADDADDAEPGGAKAGASPAAVGALFAAWIEIPTPSENDAQRWLGRFAAERKARLAPAAMTRLIELVGTDLARLESEVDKAILHALGNDRVEAADVEAVTARTRTHTVWELTAAIAQSDRGRALVELGILLDDGSEAFQLLGILAFKLRQLLEGALLVREGANSRSLGAAVKVWGAELEPFYRTCRSTDPARLALALEALRRADDRLKSSAVNPRVLLEEAILLAMGAGGAQRTGRSASATT